MSVRRRTTACFATAAALGAVSWLVCVEEVDAQRRDRRARPRYAQQIDGPRAPGRPRGDRPHRGERPDPRRYSIEQAISHNAQLHTIAFSGLAFLSGDFGAATYLPPGKVCDFFGFQYMRDIDAAQKGHNPMFLGRVASNVLHVLNDQQRQVFMDLATEQAPQLEALARMRLPLIQAFHMQRDNQIPPGSAGLNKDAVIQYVARVFARDAELSLRRAEAMSQVALSLDSDQKAYLGRMKFGDFNTWPEVDGRDAIRRRDRSTPKLFKVACMTYASEFFSWTAGSLKADTYFCPERHGTYFGAFYMKGIRAKGKRDFDISTSLTGDSGRAFLNDVLTPEQRGHIAAIPEIQRGALAEIVSVREAIAQELRKLLEGQSPDRERIIELGRRYGELDGEMSWYYVMAFARINRTLSEQQRTALAQLRNLDGYESAPYYIYSRGADTPPDVGDVSFFFFPP